MRVPFLILLLLVTTGCAQQRSDGPAEPLLRAPLPVESFGEQLSLSQVVASTYHGETHSLRVETEISSGKLVMVGISHIGVPLFEATLKGVRLEFRSLAGEELPFDPRYILSDFQLAYWPFHEVERALAREGYELAQGESEAERLVYDGKAALVVRVRHLQAAGVGADLLIEHFDLPYRLRIKTLERGESL